MTSRREQFNYSRPGRVWLVTSRLGTGCHLLNSPWAGREYLNYSRPSFFTFFRLGFCHWQVHSASAVCGLLEPSLASRQTFFPAVMSVPLQNPPFSPAVMSVPLHKPPPFPAVMSVPLHNPPRSPALGGHGCTQSSRQTK